MLRDGLQLDSNLENFSLIHESEISDRNLSGRLQVQSTVKRRSLIKNGTSIILWFQNYVTVLLGGHYAYSPCSIGVQPQY